MVGPPPGSMPKAVPTAPSTLRPFLLWKARTAAREATAPPAPFPFPVMHVDTGHNFPEVIEFRDRRVNELGVELRELPPGHTHVDMMRQVVADVVRHHDERRQPRLLHGVTREPSVV